jgi:hypothetical protein
MCGGMLYKYINPETQLLEERKVFFPQPRARIPMIGDGGTVILHQWGRRNKEEDIEYDVPITGWARADKLTSNYWKHYQPDQVLLPALRFSEKGKLPKSHWFEMPDNTYLMGLKIQRRDKHFIYVVTNPAIGELEKIHPRMPLIVNAHFSPAEFDIAEEKVLATGQQKLF